jgi:XTP/dITP diphosphohydrolase
MLSKQTILIATANPGKAEEIKKIFQDSNFELKFLFDFPEQFADLNIVENAKSFEGNALIKAIIVGDLSGLITLADDSGLCVDALNGRPGVYSARYSGTGNDQDNYLKVLAEMKDVPFTERDCHYNCTVAIYDPKSKFVETVSGIWEAKLATEPKGSKSFGYAPIVLAKDFNYEKTNAEFDPEDLIAVNHRGQAFRGARKILEELNF